MTNLSQHSNPQRPYISYSEQTITKTSKHTIHWPPPNIDTHTHMHTHTCMHTHTHTYTYMHTHTHTHTHACTHTHTHTHTQRFTLCWKCYEWHGHFILEVLWIAWLFYFGSVVNGMAVLFWKCYEWYSCFILAVSFSVSHRRGFLRWPQQLLAGARQDRHNLHQRVWSFCDVCFHFPWSFSRHSHEIECS